MAKRKIHKSAKTGEIVSAAEAAAHPDTTIEQDGPEGVQAPKAKGGDVFKDARTGEIVDAKYAGQNPGSTFKVADDLPE